MTNLSEKYARAEALLPQNALADVYGLHVTTGPITGSEDFWLRVRLREGVRFFQVNPKEGSMQPLFDHDALAKTLTDQNGGVHDGDDLRLDTLSVDARTGISFSVNDKRYTMSWAGDLALASMASAAHLVSPDGRKAVFVKDHNLHLLDYETGQSEPLATDGQPHFGWGGRTRRHHGCAIRHEGPTLGVMVPLWTLFARLSL